MTYQIKELIGILKSLWKDLEITGYDFYDDRVEESHMTPVENHWDGSSYRCLSMAGGKTQYLIYQARRGASDYTSVKVLEEFKVPLEGLRFLYLEELSAKLNGMVSQSYDVYKVRPDPTPGTVRKALELAGVPASGYSLEGERKPASVCLKDKGKDGYWLEYWNSHRELTDQMGFETELIREYNPLTKQMVERLRPAAELWELALEQTFHGAYKLYLWNTTAKRIKAGGKDFFHIQESDYDKYVI